MCAFLNNIVHEIYVYIRDLICNKGPLFKHLKKYCIHTVAKYAQLLMYTKMFSKMFQ